MENDFLPESIVTGKGAMVLMKEGRFILDIKKKLQSEGGETL